MKMGNHQLNEDNKDFEELNLGNDEGDDEEILGFDTCYGQRERETREKLRKTFNLPSLDDVKEGQYLDFHYRWLWNGAAREIAKKLEFKKRVYLDLSDCEIGGEWVDEFSYVLLEKGVTINFRNNHIGWLFAARFLFERTFPEEVVINLSNNEICDLEIKDYYEEYKREIKGFPIHLEKKAKLNLSNNEIWDKWADILMNNMELEDGAELNLSNNHISDEMKQELREWEKSYHDRWINCKVIV